MKALCLGLILFAFTRLAGQNQESATSYRMAFYNTENFFDTERDTTRDYHQFDRSGDHHWSLYRYHRKLENIYKVLTAMGGWKGLSIIGLAEIENDRVLSDLIENTPLQAEHYQIIHYDSPDTRGIDVALLYRPEDFSPLFSRPIRIDDPENKKFRTRDILYVKGLLQGDTVHLFFNHWTSRYEGLLSTLPKRMLEARILRHHLDSLFRADPGARLIVMGDFNENPGDPAVKLLTRPFSDSCRLIRLLPTPSYGKVLGTLKNGSRWYEFDQVYVSQAVKNPNSGLFVKDKSFHIFDAGFLLEKDEKNLGFKPNRSYAGFKYHGGYSDHLPVFFDVLVSRSKQP